jgi:hypothetical protein
MTKGRDIAAENIGDLLEAAYAQQRNGMLRVEYSQGGRLEEGEIYLSAGQPIYARTGRLVGVNALNYLLRWRNIRFAFVATGPRPAANIFSPFFRQGNVTAPLSPHTPWQLPITDGLSWNTQEQQRVQEPAVPERISMPGIENIVPQKNGPERDIFSLGLTRRQRLIYFMIDGKRSVDEIAHTTNKTILEVEVVVNELQEQGLITL